MKNYLNPQDNPFIRTGNENGPRLPDDEVPPSENIEVPINLPDSKGRFPSEEGYKEEGPAEPSSFNTTREEGQTEADNLERDILALMINSGDGAVEIAIENGSPTPLFNIVRTADGNLEIETADGEKKNFSELTKLERRLIQHDIKTRGVI
jgi:hypothetical protein